MAVERPTLYQPIQGAWYRVLTLAGEVIEKMQFRQGAFHGLRGRILALSEVERVAVRFAPGIAGGVDRYLPVNPSPAEQDPGYRVTVFEKPVTKQRAYRCGTCAKEKTCATRGPLPTECVACRTAALPTRRFANGKQEGTSGAAIVAVLSQGERKTVAELRRALPAFRDCTIKTQLMRMSRLGMVRRARVTVNGRAVWQYQLGAVEYAEYAVLERVADEPEERWKPAAWVNPIRARALGLPTRRAA